METNGRLASQVAAEANTNIEAAMAAVYLQDLSRSGRTLDEAAALMRQERGEVRNRARDWGISFRDYEPSDRPLVLIWSRPRRGFWELRDESGVHAEARREPVEDAPGLRRWVARSIADAEPMMETGSSAEIAMRRLSLRMDRRSVSLFGVDDISIRIHTDEGTDQLAPEVAPNARELRHALAS